MAATGWWWSARHFLLFFGVALLVMPKWCEGSNLGVTSPSGFSIDTLLTCFIKEDMPEERVRLPLSPGAPGTVWLPVDTAFRRPRGNPDMGRLLEFLGRDFNDQLTSLSTPTGRAIRARDVLPVIGSGGQEQFFRPDEIEPELGDFEDDPDSRAVILSWIDSQGLGSCEVMANWTRLPDTFFPAYISGSYCLNRGCSFPPGLNCNPDIGPGRITYVGMLRWDCCWSFFDNKWNWRCGWRQVEVPLFVDCSCSCQPRFF